MTSHNCPMDSCYFNCTTFCRITLCFIGRHYIESVGLVLRWGCPLHYITLVLRWGGPLQSGPTTQHHLSPAPQPAWHKKYFLSWKEIHIYIFSKWNISNNIMTFFNLVETQCHSIVQCQPSNKCNICYIFCIVSEIFWSLAFIHETKLIVQWKFLSCQWTMVSKLNSTVHYYLN